MMAILLMLMYRNLTIKADKEPIQVRTLYDLPKEDVYVAMETPPDDRYVYFKSRHVYLLPIQKLDFNLDYHRWMYYYYPEFYGQYYLTFWPFKEKVYRRVKDDYYVDTQIYPTEESGFAGGWSSQRFINGKAYKSGLTAGRKMGGLVSVSKRGFK